MAFFMLIFIVLLFNGESGRITNRAIVFSIAGILVLITILVTITTWKIKSLSKIVDHAAKIVQILSFLGALVIFIYEFGFNNISPEPTDSGVTSIVDPFPISPSQTETPTATIIVTPTPLANTTGSTLTPMPKPIIAENAARKYYTALKNKDIDTAWGMLTTNFHTNVAPDTYETYSNFWMNKIKDVEIISISGINQPGHYYIARAKTRYFTKDDLWTKVYVIDLYFISGDKDGELYLDRSVEITE